MRREFRAFVVVILLVDFYRSESRALQIHESNLSRAVAFDCCFGSQRLFRWSIGFASVLTSIANKYDLLELFGSGVLFGAPSNGRISLPLTIRMNSIRSIQE